VIPTNRKRGIGKPVIRIIETFCLGISGDKRHHGFSSPGINGKSQYFLVSLINTKDDIFSRCSPSSFTWSSTDEHGFIHLNLSGERLQVFDGISVNGFSEHPETSLNG